jgi:aryl-alcohol dehydrogenase-like predicted oxidoreductase
MGTERFATRNRERFVPDFYRSARTGLVVSSVAFGTYLGESDDATDEAYAAAARLAITRGVNVVDTSINYRCQRSERVVGRVLRELVASGTVQRDEIVLCTKAGYIPLDTNPPTSRADYDQYVQREFIQSGIITADDVVTGGHSIAPKFLVDQARRSRRNLGVDVIDVFMVHNPEQQLSSVTPAILRERLTRAFEALEELASSGEIGVYGCATWSGLRLPAASQGHLALYDLASIARGVGGESHHFRAIELPVNLSMSEAVRVSTQRDPRERLVNVLDAAGELGIDIIASAPLLQGQLTRDLPATVRDMFAGGTDAQRALNFVHVLPGITTMAVGMRRAAHVNENLDGFRA